jgi:branched-chain amino acid transport system substrate-binding protein
MRENGANVPGYMRRRTLLAAAAGVPFALAAQRASAQGGANGGGANGAQPLKIGVLCDMSGPYSDDTGSGLVAAVNIAAAEMGGSVLGRPITILSADDQNKPDTGVAIARKWFDEDVGAIVTASASSITLAVATLARARNKVLLVGGSLSADITGKECAPTTFQFGLDTYAGPKSVVGPSIRKGLDTWYILYVDYAFGQSLKEEATRQIKQAGGKLLGSTAFPLGSSDLSSALLAAQASGAKAIALACGGSDWSNLVKQASEFGIMQHGQSLISLTAGINEIMGAGPKICEGMLASMPFYWDLDAGTRAFNAKFRPMHNGGYPNWQQADGYDGALHYLKAIKATGTTDGAKVAAAMHATPVDDMIIKGAQIRADGQVMRPTYLMRVKPETAPGRADILELVSTIAPEDSWRPANESACPLLNRA